MYKNFASDYYDRPITRLCTNISAANLPQTKRVKGDQRRVLYKIKVFRSLPFFFQRRVGDLEKPLFTYRIPIQPPLQTRRVKTVTVVIEPSLHVKFLAGKAVHIFVGQAAAPGERIAIRVIPVTGSQALCAGHQVRDIPVAIRMVIIVRAPIAAGISM
jgi:hypothetical protein